MLFSRKTVFCICAIVVAVWVAVCYNPFLLWFQNDDFSHILLSKQGVLFQKNSFRPVCDLSVMMDYFLWKKYAPGYHITNLVLHIICSVLVFLVSRRVFLLFNCCRPFYAAGCSLLFFVYPFHGEAVFWILGRSGILGAIFSLVFLLFFLREKRSLLNSTVSLAAWGLALLTYESCWVLPLIAAVLSKADGAKPFSEKVKRYYGVAVIFMLYLVARFMANHTLVGDYEGANFLQLNEGVLLGNYFKLAAMALTTYSDSHIILRVGFFASFAVLAVLFFRFFSVPGLKLLCCFIISLLPYLSLGIDTHGTEGERFLYLPSVFAVLLTVVVIGRLQNKYLLYGWLGFTVFLYAAQLYFTAVNYRFAGNVVKQTLTAIADEPAGSNISIEGLPKSQHGALILANGLPDAQALYLSPQKGISINIVSWRYELNPLQVPYKTVFLHAAPGVPVIKYVFTDSALLIYRQNAASQLPKD